MIDIGTNYLPLSEFTTKDLVAAIVTLQSADRQIKQVFCSSYHAGDDSPVPNLFKKLVDYCSKEGLELIYACDANAHNTFWGSKNTDNRGVELMEFAFQRNLDLLNIGNVPTLFTIKYCFFSYMESALLLLVSQANRSTESFEAFRAEVREVMNDHFEAYPSSEAQEALMVLFE